MINFYQEWKNDKDGEPKKKKSLGKFKCPLCNRRSNSLKQHMNDAHGKGTYQKYLKAIDYMQEQKRHKLIELMEKL